MRNYSTVKVMGFALASTITLSACVQQDQGTMGSLSLNITDAPVDDAEHVYVQFSGVEVHGPSGSHRFDIDPPQRIDLLELQGSASSALLQDIELPAGRYNWVRLKVDTAGDQDSYIVIAGNSYRLTIPSGDQRGLQLNRGFEVPANGSAHVTVDFDLRKSVHSDKQSGYILRPTLRMVDNREAGHIRGTVGETFLSNCATAEGYVYVYAGADASPDDVGTEMAPVTTATVSFVENEYRYEAGFLTAGEYTVAFTCEGGGDDPSSDDDINFIGAANVEVVAGHMTTHDFIE